MIEVYPVKIEAIDNADGTLLFTLETFDEAAATLKCNCLLSPSNIDELCTALKSAVLMLQLEVGE